VKTIDWIVRVWDSRNHLLNYWIIEESTLTTALQQAEEKITKIENSNNWNISPILRKLTQHGNEKITWDPEESNIKTQ
jgi:hypothetical protein|tara:strand:+ start:2089 stop:2322 length:234 start_codon:yes stop_codon:yes gene_type:complete